jgi:hypothetical protein
VAFLEFPELRGHLHAQECPVRVVFLLSDLPKAELTFPGPWQNQHTFLSPWVGLAVGVLRGMEVILREAVAVGTSGQARQALGFTPSIPLCLSCSECQGQLAFLPHCPLGTGPHPFLDYIRSRVTPNFL